MGEYTSAWDPWLRSCQTTERKVPTHQEWEPAKSYSWRGARILRPPCDHRKRRQPRASPGVVERHWADWVRLSASQIAAHPPAPSTPERRRISAPCSSCQHQKLRAPGRKRARDPQRESSIYLLRRRWQETY